MATENENFPLLVDQIELGFNSESLADAETINTVLEKCFLVISSGRLGICVRLSDLPIRRPF